MDADDLLVFLGGVDKGLGGDGGPDPFACFILFVVELMDLRLRDDDEADEAGMARGSVLVGARGEVLKAFGNELVNLFLVFQDPRIPRSSKATL